MRIIVAILILIGSAGAYIAHSANDTTARLDQRWSGHVESSQVVVDHSDWQALLEFCDKDVFEVAGGSRWVAMLPLGADVEPSLVLTIDEFDPAYAGFFAQLTYRGLCRCLTGIEAAGD